MNRICYFTIECSSNDGAGVEYKINRQMTEFQKHGYEVKLCQYDMNRKGFRKIVSNIHLLNKNYDARIIDELCSCDVIYMRYFLMDYNVLYILKHVKKRRPSIKIFVEIPTYPYDQEFPIKSLSLRLDMNCRVHLHKYVDKIISFSDDKEIWRIPTVTISNGVDVEKITKRSYVKIDGAIHCIAVAKLAFWHGYDRLIEGLYEYSKQPHEDQFVLHIVGDGNEVLLNELKEKTKKYNLQNNVIFHGRLVGEKLAQVYSYCTIAFDSLGRHRCGIRYNSTLKGKEYLAKGLPIVSGVQTELDDIKDYPYYFRVPADDSFVNFGTISTFYHDIYDLSTVSKVTETIRRFCVDNFTFETTFIKVIDLLK